MANEHARVATDEEIIEELRERCSGPGFDLSNTNVRLIFARIDADAKRIAELEGVLREIARGKLASDMGDGWITAARLSGLARHVLKETR